MTHFAVCVLIRELQKIDPIEGLRNQFGINDLNNHTKCFSCSKEYENTDYSYFLCLECKKLFEKQPQEFYNESYYSRKLDFLMEPYYENKPTDPYISKTKEQIMAELETKKNKIEDYRPEYQEKLLSWTPEEYYLDEIKYCEPNELDKDGNKLSTYNPNAKYDYYSEGGKWIILKNGQKSNYCQIKEIDLEKMYSEEIILRTNRFNALKEFYTLSEEKDKFDFAIKHSIFMHDREEKPLQNESFEQWLQRTAPLEKTIPSILGIPQWVYETETNESIWLTDRENGWFGIHQKITDTNEFRITLEKIFANYSKNDYLIILDCHI